MKITKKIQQRAADGLIAFLDNEVNLDPNAKGIEVECTRDYLGYPKGESVTATEKDGAWFIQYHHKHETVMTLAISPLPSQVQFVGIGEVKPLGYKRAGNLTERNFLGFNLDGIKRELEEYRDCLDYVPRSDKER